MKRDLHLWKETCIYEKIPAKETYFRFLLRGVCLLILYQRLASIKSDLKKRPTWWKETYIDVKRPIDKTNFRLLLRGVGLLIRVHETYIYGKRPIKEKETCIDEKRPKIIHEKRPISACSARCRSVCMCTRDLHLWEETYKRERDLYRWKKIYKRDLFPPALRGVNRLIYEHETYIYGKRPINETYIRTKGTNERDPYLWKETCKRDIFPPALCGVYLLKCEHETYTYGKRPIKENYMYQRDGWKRPTSMERDL